MTQQNQTQETAAGGNLDNASQFVKLASLTGKIEQGKRLIRVIAKTTKDGTKELAESLGLIVPDNLVSVAECAKYPTLNAVMLEALHDLQTQRAKVAALAGESQVWHAELSPEKLEAFAAESNEELGRLTLAEITEFVKANTVAAVAAYETVTGKSVEEAKQPQVINMVQGVLQLLTKSAKEVMLLTDKQETIVGLIVESCESPIKGKLQSKLASAKKNRAAMIEAAAGLEQL